MRREGIIRINVPGKHYDGLAENKKKKYNRSIATNKTIGRPYGCPRGGRSCIVCRNPKPIAKIKRLERNQIINKYMKNDFLIEDDFSINDY